MNANLHPTDDEIRAFAAGELEVDLDTLTAHLESCATCLEAVERVSADPFAARIAAARQSEQTAADAPDGYELLEEIGRGGSGIVYRARQSRLDRMVALKRLAAGRFAGSAELARFRREAQLLAGLSHPHIVAIFDAGNFAGEPYLAMEWIAGGDLGDRLEQGPLPPRDAATVVRQLAEAIASAHSQRIVHRDLKPRNVLLAPDTTYPIGAPKIVDFGLARPWSHPSQATRSGELLGTPAYMAPEQTTGRGDEVGPACDIYGLGGILYACLCGQPPFSGATILETLEQIRTHDPVSPRRLRPAIPRDLETICLKCLEKDPRRRYASARILADELGRYLQGQPILARPSGRLERCVKWVRRRPAQAGLLGLALGGLIGFCALTWSHNRSLRAHARRATDGEARAVRERSRADQGFRDASQTVRDMVARINSRDLPDVPRVREFLLEEYEIASRFLRTQVVSQGDPVAMRELADLLTEMAKQQIALGQVEKARINLLDARAIHQQHPPDTATAHAAFAGCLNSLAFIATNPREASEYHLTAIASLESAIHSTPDDRATRSSLARSLHNLAQCQNSLGDVNSAETNTRRAVDLRTALFDEDPADPRIRWELAGSLSNWGLWLRKLGQSTEASAASHRARELLAALVKEQPHEHGYAIDLGLVQVAQVGMRGAADDFLELRKGCEECIQLLGQVLEIEPNHVAAKHTLAKLHGCRAQLSHDLKRPQEALADWEHAIQLGDPETRALALGSRLADLIGYGDHEAATKAALEYAEEPARTPDEIYNAACAFSLAIPLAQADTALDESARAQRIHRYAAEAIRWLQSAAASGLFQDPRMANHLRVDTDLAPLHEIPEFSAFLRRAVPEPALPVGAVP